MVDLAEYLKRQKKIDDANIKWVDNTLSPERQEEIAIALLAYCKEFNVKECPELMNPFNGEASGILAKLERDGCYCEPGKMVGEIPQEGGYYEEFDTDADDYKDYLSETGFIYLNRGYAWSEQARRNIERENFQRYVQETQLALSTEANSTARLAVSKADEANQIARVGNSLASAANTLAQSANDIAVSANKLAGDANIIANNSNTIAGKSNTIAIVCGCISIVLALASLLVAILKP